MPDTITDDDISTKIADLLRVPADRVQPETVLTELITDSFMLVELVIEMQEEYGVRFAQDDVQHARTVAQLAELVRLRSRDA